jgi:hypothetical protein
MFLSPGFFEMKMKYDESDNALIRASRAVTDRVTDLMGEACSLIPGASPSGAPPSGAHIQTLMNTL